MKTVTEQHARLLIAENRAGEFAPSRRVWNPHSVQIAAEIGGKWYLVPAEDLIDVAPKVGLPGVVLAPRPGSEFEAVLVESGGEAAVVGCGDPNCKNCGQGADPLRRIGAMLAASMVGSILNRGPENWVRQSAEEATAAAKVAAAEAEAPAAGGDGVPAVPQFFSDMENAPPIPRNYFFQGGKMRA